MWYLGTQTQAQGESCTSECRIVIIVLMIVMLNSNSGCARQAVDGNHAQFKNLSASNIDLGMIPAKVSVTAFGVLRNNSQGIIKVRSAKTSCNCVEVLLEASEIGSNGYAFFSVLVDGAHMKGGSTYDFEVEFIGDTNETAATSQVHVSIGHEWPLVSPDEAASKAETDQILPVADSEMK